MRQPDPGALQMLVALITPLIFPLTTTGVVFIFVVFILVQRQDLRNRLVRLAGAQDLQRTTAALDDAGTRLSRLFLTQLALNAAFGVVIGVGLWIIGVPSAPLWGMLAMILRFVPYVGALISAVFPVLLAAAVDPGWTMVLWTAVLFIVLEPIVGHVIEPMMYGHSSGLSPVAVIAAATFWTWLWGAIGLILATPLTICLVVLGRHVDRLKFLEVMLGDQPALTRVEVIYQSMLARDPVEATEQARLFLRQKPLIAYYDEILLEGLRLAQADAERDRLDEELMRRIRDAVGGDRRRSRCARGRAGARGGCRGRAAVAARATRKSRSRARCATAARAMANREAGVVHPGSGVARRSRRHDDRAARRKTGNWGAGRAGRCLIDVADFQSGHEGR